jgi:exosortase
MSKVRSEQQGAPGIFSAHFVIMFVPIIILIGFLYQDVVIRLVHIWITDSDQAHGLLLVAVAGYLVFHRRNMIKQIKPEIWMPGLFIMVGAIALLLMGQVVVEYFVMRASLIILLVGVIGFLFGKKALKVFFFLLFLLLLAIPLPAIVVNSLTLPLKALVSTLASEMLRVMGVSILQEGNILQTPQITLEVVNACSGIRSVFSLFVLALLFCSDMDGYFQKALLLILTIPLAIFTNALRITATGMLATHWDPKTALGFYHGFSGWVIFVLSLVLLLLLKRVIVSVASGRKPGRF